MTDLYLIAHKVRGEPAFDIAQRATIGDEEGWIIPTSGHRAYPFWSYPLKSIVFRYTDEGGMDRWTFADWVAETMPSDAADHYAANDRPSREPTGFKIDLRALGLSKPKPPIMRRV